MMTSDMFSNYLNVYYFYQGLRESLIKIKTQNCMFFFSFFI